MRFKHASKTATNLIAPLQKSSNATPNQFRTARKKIKFPLLANATMRGAQTFHHQTAVGLVTNNTRERSSSVMLHCAPLDKASSNFRAAFIPHHLLQLASHHNVARVTHAGAANVGFVSSRCERRQGCVRPVCRSDASAHGRDTDDCCMSEHGRPEVVPQSRLPRPPRRHPPHPYLRQEPRRRRPRPR